MMTKAEATPILSAAWLRLHRASCDQVVLFEREWPNGIPLDAPREILEAHAHRAVDLGLNIDWLACQILTRRVLAKYHKDQAHAATRYGKARSAALFKFETTMTTAWVKCQKARGAALIDGILKANQKKGGA